MQAALSTLFVVWRESVEALLVIGILCAWLKQNHLAPQLKRLWLGAALGLALAGCLAAVFFAAGYIFSGPAGDWFFAVMMLLASLLIMQMTVFMHRSGRMMKARLENDAAASLEAEGGLGILLISMIAVAREGSETVIFLAGIGAQYAGVSLGLFVLGGACGFALALLSFYILCLLANAVSWKWYFRVSAFALLLIGGAMAVGAADKIAGQLSAYDLPEWLFSFIGDPLWNTGALISGNSAVSSLLASLAGYRSQPSAMEISALALYWALALWLCLRKTAPRAKAEYEEEAEQNPQACR